MPAKAKGKKRSKAPDIISGSDFAINSKLTLSDYKSVQINSLSQTCKTLVKNWTNRPVASIGITLSNDNRSVHNAGRV